MNCKNCLLGSIIFSILALLGPRFSLGQNAYAVSDAFFDTKTRQVITFSATIIDLDSGLYYDPAVVGGIFHEGVKLETSASHVTAFEAVVSLGTTKPSPPNAQFDAISDHYLIAFFRTPTNDDPGLPYQWLWYDPLGFDAYGGGANSGWYKFAGRRLVEYPRQRAYNLGTTGTGVLTDNRSSSE